MSEPTIIQTPESKPAHSVWLPIFGVGLLIAAAAIIYQSTQTEDLRRQFQASQRDKSALRASLNTTGTELQNELTALRDELAQNRQVTTADVANARSITASHAAAVATPIRKIENAQNQRTAYER